MRRYAERVGGVPPVVSRGSRGWVGGTHRLRRHAERVGGTLGASIHDVEIWVSGWGELEGGKVTRSQPPPRGVSGVAQTGVSFVAQIGVSVVAQTGVSGVGQTGGVNSRFVGCVATRRRPATGGAWWCFRGVCIGLPFRTRCDTCALGIAPSEPVNPLPYCGFGHRNT